MYTDLSILCKVIGITSESDLSTQAADLYRAITGLDEEFSLSTGSGMTNLVLTQTPTEMTLSISRVPFTMAKIQLSNGG